MTSAARTRQVLVAGTAGGVGTTTVTALLFNAWMGRAGAPRLADHTAGTLGLRLAEGDEAGRLDDDTVLVDAGAHAFGLGRESQADDLRLVVVTAATPGGCDVAHRCLAAIGPDVTARAVLVINGAYGRRRVSGPVRRLAAEHPRLLGLVVVPTDLALAAGGRIPLSRLSRATRRAVDEVAGLVSGLPTAPGARVSG